MPPPEPPPAGSFCIDAGELSIIADEPVLPGGHRELATVAVTVDDDVVIAAITGEIDRSNATPVLLSLAEAVPNSARGLVIDCTSLDYVDSAGVYVLFTLASRLETHQQRLVIATAPGSHVEQVMELTQMQQMAEVFTSAADACKSLRA